MKLTHCTPTDIARKMKQTTIAIPSYQRAQQLYDKTYTHVLKPLGLATHTIIFIQTDEDMDTYSKLFHNTGLRFERGPQGFAEVNYFIEHFFAKGTRVVVMHDDLKGILALKQSSITQSDGGDVGKVSNAAFKKMTENQECHELFENAFEHMANHSLSLGGVNTVKNAMWASGSPAVSFDLKFVWDPLHFMISTHATQQCKHFHFDDVERTIQAFKRDGGVLRMNHYAIDTTNEPYNAKAQGGLAGQRTKEGAEKAAAAMEEEYKEYLNKFGRHKSGTFKPNLKRLPFKSEANTIENPLKTTKETQKSPCAPPAKETFYYKGFLDPQQCKELMDCLLEECQPYMVKYGHQYRSTTASRPKCNMAEPIEVNGQLHWPAYKWGQVLDDLPLIQKPPALVSDIARQLEKHFGHPAGYLNSPMATFYYHGTDQKLLIHQDKAHSYQSTGLIETHAHIYNLSLGADRCFVITDLDSIGKVQRKDMNIYEDIRMSSGDLVVLTPNMNQNWGHGVPEDSSATELRISLVFRHCTKYWIRQLEDKTWEESQRHNKGQEGKWKALSASKDGEPDDPSERMALRRQQAQQKLEQQAEQRRAKEERSHKKRKTHMLSSENLQSSGTSNSSQPNNDDDASPETPETPQPTQTATHHDIHDDNHDDNHDNQDNGGEPTQNDYDKLDKIRDRIKDLKKRKRKAEKTGLSTDHPRIKKLEGEIEVQLQTRKNIYAEIGNRPSELNHHEDAQKLLQRNTAKIERSCNQLSKLAQERSSLGNVLEDFFEQEVEEDKQELQQHLVTDHNMKQERSQSSNGCSVTEVAEESQAASAHKLQTLRNEIPNLRDKRRKLLERMPKSKHKSKDEARAQDIMKEIDEKTKQRDDLYKSMPNVLGPCVQHDDAKRDFDKHGTGMQRDVQRILKRNDDMQCAAHEMSASYIAATDLCTKRARLE